MTRDTFFKELKKHLKGCNKEELDEIIEDYTEYFNDAIESGRTEEDVSEALGSPKFLARQLIAENAIKIAEEGFSIDNILRATLAIIGLGFFNLVFVLGPAIGIAAVLFAFSLVSIVFFILGLVSPIGLFFINEMSWFNILVYFLIAISIFAGGTALGSFTLILTRGVYKVVVKYLKLNLKIIKGGQ